MTWPQPIDPLNNLALSALIALVPILFIFWALIIKKMQGHKASLLGTATAVIVAIVVYGMPVNLAFLSTANGILYGLFPICWIIIAVIYLFNVTVKSGQFEVIKHSMASITPDRRLQALLIAFSFGAFLEGTAGFGAPVAITGALLMGLGFDAFYAAGICLIANTAPVAFGAIGIPITVASHVSGILYPFFAPLLGWLGVFITGSDTSSNALFGKLQYATATSIGVNPVVTVAANSSGGVVGKMISPQSIAVGASAVGLIGKEAKLFRFTVKHSLIMLSFICIFSFAQAYFIEWIIPNYKMHEAEIVNAMPDISKGYYYLLILIIILIVIVFFVMRINRGKKLSSNKLEIVQNEFDM